MCDNDKNIDDVNGAFSPGDPGNTPIDDVRRNRTSSKDDVKGDNTTGDSLNSALSNDEVNMNYVPGGSGNTALSNAMGDTEQIEILRQERKRLKKLLDSKEEIVRKLKLVKMYDSKHNLDELESLIVKWRSAAQEAAEELYDMFDDPKPHLGEFLTQLHVDHQIINFDTESETFQ